MRRPLRALLLAAGLGTRLRPITLHTPKCLVSINGEPLLGRWLRQLDSAGCEAVLINTHYLADQVEAFLQERPAGPMRVHTIHEPKLLGTRRLPAGQPLIFRRFHRLLIHFGTPQGLAAAQELLGNR
jgi:mannose-1-phosphate guanylyltransferase